MSIKQKARHKLRLAIAKISAKPSYYCQASIVSSNYPIAKIYIRKIWHRYGISATMKLFITAGFKLCYWHTRDEVGVFHEFYLQYHNIYIKSDVWEDVFEIGIVDNDNHKIAFIALPPNNLLANWQIIIDLFNKIKYQQNSSNDVVLSCINYGFEELEQQDHGSKLYYIQQYFIRTPDISVNYPYYCYSIGNNVYEAERFEIYLAPDLCFDCQLEDVLPYLDKFYNLPYLQKTNITTPRIKPINYEFVDGHSLVNHHEITLFQRTK
ncbi:MAG: hypothetical protein QG673_1604 [Pseudomonadota bacterium]|nr:hypothetical protein [Pseudomonadota bacterium]